VQNPCSDDQCRSSSGSDRARARGQWLRESGQSARPQLSFTCSANGAADLFSITATNPGSEPVLLASITAVFYSASGQELGSETYWPAEVTAAPEIIRSPVLLGLRRVVGCDALRLSRQVRSEERSRALQRRRAAARRGCRGAARPGKGR
jgi:hypothetical protein